MNIVYQLLLPLSPIPPFFSSIPPYLLFLSLLPLYEQQSCLLHNYLHSFVCTTQLSPSLPTLLHNTPTSLLPQNSHLPFLHCFTTPPHQLPHNSHITPPLHNPHTTHLHTTPTFIQPHLHNPTLTQPHPHTTPPSHNPTFTQPSHNPHTTPTSHNPTLTNLPPLTFRKGLKFSGRQFCIVPLILLRKSSP